MIAIVGKSGSGKNTVLKILENYGYKSIISYTTRPKRCSETEGVEYHFIKEEEFVEKLKNGFFAEYVTYRNWYYGIAKEDLTEGKICIVETKGLKHFKIFKKDITVVYIEASYKVRINRLFKRGDDAEEISRRLSTDNELFGNFVFSGDVNYIIENNGSLKDLENEVVEFLDAYNCRCKKDILED
jgi:guanylate kinase